MKNVFFIAVMLTGQIFAQMEIGTYYCNDVYYCDVENQTIINMEKLNLDQYIVVEDNGVRFHGSNRLGLYHAWTFIGDFGGHDTYILSNNSKLCIAPEINGIYYFYEKVYNNDEYKKLIQFNNIEKISYMKDNDGGEYLMDIE